MLNLSNTFSSLLFSPHLTFSYLLILTLSLQGGKGRTGTVIGCYLLLTGLFDDPVLALEYFGNKRSAVALGVTQPDQKRYITERKTKTKQYNNITIFSHIYMQLCGLFRKDIATEGGTLSSSLLPLQDRHVWSQSTTTIRFSSCYQGYLSISPSLFFIYIFNIYYQLIDLLITVLSCTM